MIDHFSIPDDAVCREEDKVHGDCVCVFVCVREREREREREFYRIPKYLFQVSGKEYTKILACCFSG